MSDHAPRPHLHPSLADAESGDWLEGDRLIKKDAVLRR